MGGGSGAPPPCFAYALAACGAFFSNSKLHHATTTACIPVQPIPLARDYLSTWSQPASPPPSIARSLESCRGCGVRGFPNPPLVGFVFLPQRAWENDWENGWGVYSIDCREGAGRRSAGWTTQRRATSTRAGCWARRASSARTLSSGGLYTGQVRVRFLLAWGGEARL